MSAEEQKGELPTIKTLQQEDDEFNDDEFINRIKSQLPIPQGQRVNKQCCFYRYYHCRKLNVPLHRRPGMRYTEMLLRNYYRQLFDVSRFDIDIEQEIEEQLNEVIGNTFFMVLHILVSDKSPERKEIEFQSILAFSYFQLQDLIDLHTPDGSVLRDTMNEIESIQIQCKFCEQTVTYSKQRGFYLLPPIFQLICMNLKCWTVMIFDIYTCVFGDVSVGPTQEDDYDYHSLQPSNTQS